MPERLSALDAQFLYLESENVPFHMAGLCVLESREDGPLRFEDLVELIGERIHLVPRFRKRVVWPPLGLGRPVWVDDRRFDLSNHLHRSTLPPPGGRTELAAFAEDVHARPLDRDRPLWEMHFIEGLEEGHVAVLAKTHHAMIDGISGMDLASVMFDFTREPQRLTPPPWEPEREPDPGELLVDSITDQLARPLEAILEGINRAIVAPRELLGMGTRLLGGFGSLLQAGIPGAGPFSHPVGPNRRYSMAEVPVADAKAVKNALGGTVNDVILAAVTGALRRLLRERGEKVRGVTLRALVPVSTRDDSERMAFGNKVSVFFTDLPVGTRSPAARLRKITAATRTLKERDQAVAAGALMNLGAWAPPTIHALAARLIGRQKLAHLAVSNVPGPQVPLYLAGARLVVTYPVMPIGQSVGLSVAVTSLSGTMGFGFTGDADQVPDIDVLAMALLESFDELKKAAGA